MIISLRDFALTGRFGPVSIGMHKDEVIRLLGKPDGMQDFGTGFSGIIYGGYEFFIDNSCDKLDAIQNDSFSKLEPATCEFKNAHFEIEPWLFRSPQWHTLKSTQQHLRKQEIAFQLKDQYGRMKVLLQSGVYLDFDDEGADPDLIGIRHFPRWDEVRG